MRVVLAADIGGTFSRFALFRLEETEQGFSLALEPEGRLTLATREAGSFSDLLLRWRQASGVRPDCAALAAPAPVPPAPGAGDEMCLAPNIAWPLSRREAEEALGAPCGLLNDFAAQGLACLFPEIQGLSVILPGRARPGFSSVALGAGTGLGKAQILPALPIPGGEPSGQNLRRENTGGNLRLFIPAETLPEGCMALRRRVLPSEGGHALFPFQGGEEASFEAFARDLSRREEVIGDMVVSGYGLSLLYAFHNGGKRLLPPEDVSPRIHEQPLVLEWFARFLGRACRNFALETLALGGVCISGGMIAHLPDLPHHPALAKEFRRSETQKHLLENLPLWRVTNPDAGLWGSAVYGLGL